MKGRVKLLSGECHRFNVRDVDFGRLDFAQAEQQKHTSKLSV